MVAAAGIEDYVWTLADIAGLIIRVFAPMVLQRYGRREWFWPALAFVATFVIAIGIPVRHVLSPNFPGRADCAQPPGPNPPFQCYSPHTHWFMLARLAVLATGLLVAWALAARARHLALWQVDSN